MSTSPPSLFPHPPSQSRACTYVCELAAGLINHLAANGQPRQIEMEGESMAGHPNGQPLQGWPFGLNTLENPPSLFSLDPYSSFPLSFHLPPPSVSPSMSPLPSCLPSYLLPRSLLTPSMHSSSSHPPSSPTPSSLPRYFPLTRDPSAPGGPRSPSSPG